MASVSITATIIIPVIAFTHTGLSRSFEMAVTTLAVSFGTSQLGYLVAVAAVISYLP